MGTAMNLKALNTARCRAGRSPAARGFTLLELLIVISIIAILTVGILAIASRVGAQRKIALAKLQIKTIEEAAKSYYQDFGVYPPDTGIYEEDDQPPTGLSADSCKYAIVRYLGTRLSDKITGKQAGPYLPDLRPAYLKGDPTDCDGIPVQLYIDPWGHPYEMNCLHSKRDAKTGQVTVSRPYPAGTPDDEMVLEVRAWSAGPDGKSTSGATYYPYEQNSDDNDNIMSWSGTKGKK
jgi:prepilin-type N-terminal cleavage/methylation domain-containing protein